MQRKERSGGTLRSPMLPILALCLALMASPPPARSADRQVLVGQGGNSFTPANFTAAQGDTVTFVWVPLGQGGTGTNHSVTQSSFAAPCEPLINASTDERGFDSGYQAVAAGTSDAPAWTLEITSTSPIWFYCAQANHCEQGMVGAINAPARGRRSFEAFRNAAMEAIESGPADGSARPSGIGAAATAPISSVAGFASGASSASGSASPSASSSSDSGNSNTASPRARSSSGGKTLVVLLALLVVGLGHLS
ncbi:hypothetical protein JCM10207_000925 [Rhodosporidiobolus poonsookiae]